MWSVQPSSWEVKAEGVTFLLGPCVLSEEETTGSARQTGPTLTGGGLGDGSRV